MDLELYKKQSLDLFKRFEIAVPQKKTEPVFQAGNEIAYKTIRFAADSTYMACAASSRYGQVYIRQLPSGKFTLMHSYNSYLQGMSNISADNLAFLWFDNRENYLVKFPEGDILYAFSGFVFDVILCSDQKTFLIHNNNDYLLFRSKDDLIYLSDADKEIRDVQISPCMGFALIIYNNVAEVFSLTEGKTVYLIEENYKIYQASFSADGKYFIYSAREKEFEGCLKTIETATGRIISETFAVLHDAEFLAFSQGWLLNTGKLAIYYPLANLIKELPVGYIFKDAIENQNGQFLMRLNTYRDSNYIDHVRFEVYNLNQIYNEYGEPNPIRQVDYEARSTNYAISPDKKILVVYYNPQFIEVYKTGDFNTIMQIKVGKDTSVAMEFTPNSNYFMVSAQSQLTIYDTQTFTPVNQTAAGLDSCLCLPQNDYIVLVDQKSAIGVRNIKNGRLAYGFPESNIYTKALALQGQQLWTTHNKKLQCANLANNTIKSYDTITYRFEAFTNHHFICKHGIVDTQSGNLSANELIKDLFDDSWFYSFKKYSVKANVRAISVFENKTGQLIIQLIAPTDVKFDPSIVVCSDMLYFTEQTNTLKCCEIKPGAFPVKTVEIAGRNLKYLDEDHFYITASGNSHPGTRVIVYTCSNLDEPLTEFQLEDNVYKAFVSPASQTIMLANESLCWYIDIKNPEKRFKIHQREILGATEYNEMLVIILPTNQILFYATSSQHGFEPGELLATLYTIPDGYLWVTPPDAASLNGWFWTDQPKYIEVMQYTDKKHDYDFLPQTSPEWKKYIELHNREDMVMNRLHNPEAYRQNLSDIQGKIQHLQLQQFKHTLMLNN